VSDSASGTASRRPHSRRRLLRRTCGTRRDGGCRQPASRSARGCQRAPLVEAAQPPSRRAGCRKPPALTGFRAVRAPTSPRSRRRRADDDVRHRERPAEVRSREDRLHAGVRSARHGLSARASQGWLRPHRRAPGQPSPHSGMSQEKSISGYRTGDRTAERALRAPGHRRTSAKTQAWSDAGTRRTSHVRAGSPAPQRHHDPWLT